jgi:hypothetical protein
MVTRKRGEMQAETRECLNQAIAFLADKRVAVAFSDVSSSNLARNRAKSVRNAQEINADYLMFLDDDMVFDADAIYNMWRQKEDILSGVAVKKAYPHTPGASMINLDTGKHDITPHIPPQGIIEVDAVGTGFLMVKMSVFRAVAMPWFGFVPNGLFEDYAKLHEAVKLGLGRLANGDSSDDVRARLAEVMVDIIPPQKDRTGTTGEDYYFCARARECGFKIKVDCGVRVGHIGLCPYTIDHYFAVKKLEEEDAGGGSDRTSEPNATAKAVA